jgi:hypothetical protein
MDKTTGETSIAKIDLLFRSAILFSAWFSGVDCRYKKSQAGSQLE